MNKRTFLKTSSLLLGGAISYPSLSCRNSTGKQDALAAGGERLMNWAGNLKCSTGNVHFPKTVEDVQAIVNNPSIGKELQSEYFVPIEHAYNAIMAIEKLHDKISPHLFISEVRTINADNYWMSPCYKKTCVAIHTTWKQEVDTVMGLLPLMEEQLAPFYPIPHWAKLSTMSPAVRQSRFEKLNDFKQLITKHDPKGKFRNDFINENLFTS